MSVDQGAFQFDLVRYRFDQAGVNRAVSDLYGKHSWPLVYVLSDNKRVYVGETANVPLRLNTHLRSDEKRYLRDLRLVTSPQFNKSSALHLEAKLISYLAGDGSLKLVNKSAGLVDHDYYQQDRYEELFEKLWDRLRDENLARKTLAQIDNSDLFKFSPYKSLSADQVAAVVEVIKHLSGSKDGPIFVQGAAGTGKSVLAVFLIKLLVTDLGAFEQAVEGEGNAEQSALSVGLLWQLKGAIANPRVGFVVAMTSLRNTLKAVFKSIDGLSPKQVMSPVDASKTEEPYDVLFVDEAHRLRKRRAISWMGTYDKTNRRLGLPIEADELDWVLLKSKRSVLFYDGAQSIKPSDVDEDRFRSLMEDAPVVHLQTQHRSRGGQTFTRFVRELLDDSWGHRQPFDANDDFELLMFDELGDMVDRIKARNEEVGLSRLVAGYAWPWISKKDSSAFDIEIGDVRLQWNRVADNWINSPTAVDEVGCIHTTQGYDLNFVGVIFGDEIGYDNNTQRIIIRREKYHDRNGKAGVDSEEQLARYIKQVYYTMLCRGIRGVYVYVHDPELREHFGGFFRGGCA